MHVGKSLLFFVGGRVSVGLSFVSFSCFFELSPSFLNVAVKSVDV